MNLKFFQKAIHITFTDLVKNIQWQGIVFLIVAFLFIISGFVVLQILAALFYILFFYFGPLEAIKQNYRKAFTDENNFPDGNHKVYESSYSKNNYKIINKKNGKLEGEFIRYYNNKIDYTCNYKNGLKDGPYRNFGQEGNISFECNYKNGLKDGFYRNFYPNGNISFETFYSNDIQNGDAVTYNKNQLIVRKSQVVDGNVIESYEYYPNGKLRMYNRGNIYEFYLWNDDLKKSMKTCSINLNTVINNIDRMPTYSEKTTCLGIWNNYDFEGSLDYQINFHNQNEIKKINFSKDGGIESERPIKINLIGNSILSFYSKYAKSRLIPNNEGNYIYTYNNGFMGPPGINQDYDVDIEVINSLSDIIDVEYL